MILSRKSILSHLIMVQFITLVLPYSVAKPVTFILIPLIVMMSGEMVLNRRFYGLKFLLVALVIPGFLMTLYYDILSVIRFIPYMALVLLFPYKGIKIDRVKLFYVSFGVVVYIVLFQIMIAYNISFAVYIRDNYYPIENNVWGNSGIVSGMDLRYRELRFGGIFYNPNVCASNMFMYFAACLYLIDVIRERKKQIIVESVLLIIAIMSILYAGSRTYIAALIVFMVFKHVDVEKVFLKGRIMYRNLPYYIIVFATVMYLLWIGSDSLISGTFEKSGSLNIKNQILFNYLSYFVNYNQAVLLFGGIHRVQFDADVGYVIGGFGLIGFVSVLLFYRGCIKEIYGAFPFVIAMLLTSLGNSVIYNLAASIQLLIVLIIISKIPNKKHY